jgi:hypothetical protein
MNPAVKLHATAKADTQSLARCEHALELLLTHRGSPSAEIDGVLGEDPRTRGARAARAGGNARKNKNFTRIPNLD